MRISKIFLSSKSGIFKSFKTYFGSFKWLEKVFYSSSFFGEFLFLISSHTAIPLTFPRECQLSIFAPYPRAFVRSPKIGPRRRTPEITDSISISLWDEPGSAPYHIAYSIM